MSDIHFRPNADDRRILNKIREHLSKLTKQPVFDTAAIRYALRDWEENDEMSEDYYGDKEEEK